MNCEAGRACAVRWTALAVLPLLIFAAAPSTGRSEIYCDKPAVNAGVVFTGTRLVQRFKLSNRGKAPLEVLEARASCGCLSPRLDRKRLQPSEEGTLELEINTLSQPSGPNTWTVRLRYQESGQVQETSLQLSAQLISEVMVQPAAMVLLADKAASHEVVVTDRRARPFKLVDARAGSGKLTTHIRGAERNKDGHVTFKIGVHVPIDYPEGRHDEALHVYTDDPKYPDLLVPITIVKSSPKRLCATPGEVNLTVSAGQQAPARIILIRDNQQQQVKIERVTADDPAISCRWAEGPNTMCTLKIQLNRALLYSNSLSSAVHVHLLGPIHETLTIPVKCTLLP